MIPMVVEHCLYVCKSFNDVEIGNKIAYLSYACNLLKRKDIGSEEFEIGKYDYWIDSMEIARELFHISNKNFGGKKFQDESRSDYKLLLDGNREISNEETLRG